MPSCPWCNVLMHTVDRKHHVYSCENKNCKGNGAVIQFVRVEECPKCGNPTYHKYKNFLGEMKECGRCSTRYEVKAYVSRQRIDYRIGQYERAISRMEELRDHNGS